MKKILVILIVMTVTILAGCLYPSPHHEGLRPRPSGPVSFINLYKFDSHLAAGLKQRIFRNVYAIGNVQYRETNSDLEFQAGGAYIFPRKILFFRLYGGGGIQFTRNEGYQYPYLVLGTDFLLFFSEVIHPLQNGMTPKFRAGFSFHF